MQSLRPGKAISAIISAGRRNGAYYRRLSTARSREGADNTPMGEGAVVEGKRTDTMSSDP